MNHENGLKKLGMKTVQQSICKITQLFHKDLECEIFHSRPQHSVFAAVLLTSNFPKIIESTEQK